MKKILAIALVLSIAGCSIPQWKLVPGAPLSVGDTVTLATPLPAGLDCPLTSPTTGDGRPVWNVQGLPDSTTVTLNPFISPDFQFNAPQACFTPYKLVK